MTSAPQKLIPSSHLAGFQSILRNLGTATDELLSSIKGGHASFWTIAQADLIAAYLQNERTQIDPQDLGLWKAAGLRAVSTMSSTSATISFPQFSVLNSSARREDEICRTLIWIVSKIMNFLAPKSEPQDLSHWEELRELLSQWHQHLPPIFHPYASMPTDEKHSDGSPRFIRVFFNVPMCAAALQLYHFAQILLLTNRPLDGMDVASRLKMFRNASEESNQHSRQICGIALGRNSPAVSRQMVQSLYLAGICLEEDEDRSVVLRLLKNIQSDTGCPTIDRIESLQSAWGWDTSRSFQH
jgi:hypothetical protein